MIQEIITKIEQSIQCVLCYLLNLCFQPIYCVLQIVQGIIDIWSGDENEDVNEGVKVYPSTNEGRYPEEVELPVCNVEHHIGFKINQAEQDEIKRIKEELNK